MGIDRENVELRLSIQRALVGAASPHLYGACADLQDQTIVLTWYVARAISADDREALEIAGTEVIADFPDTHTIDDRFETVLDNSTPLTTVGVWVFLQRGFQTTEA